MKKVFYLNLTILLILLLVFGALNFFYLKNSKFRNYITSNYLKIDKTIFVIPSNLNLEKKYRYLLQNPPSGTSYFDTKIRSTQFLNFEENKYFLETYNYETSQQKAVAFLSFYQNKVFIVTGDGNFYYYETKNIPTQIRNDKIFLNPNNIPTNIKDIIKDESFFNTDRTIDFSHFNSISDILVLDDYVYLSFNRKAKENCYTKSIIKAKINFDKLLFEDFFYEKDNCRNQIKNIKKYNGHQSGGRMISINKDSKFNFFNKNNDKILFTIGDFRSNRSEEIPDAQNLDSIFGKNILIDVINNEFEVLSLGHRNPQGIYHDIENDLIVSTEHGPYGGDEINNIKYKKNYGWPISSYGENYPRTPADKNKKYYFEKNHKIFNFEEPIIAFTKSIGISEIIKVPESFHEKWKGSYLIGSLNGQKLLRVIFDENLEKVITMEIIHVGERIRDLKINNDKIYMILENSPVLAIYSIEN
jgi:hypothetical protein